MSPPYSSEFVQLFLPLVESDEITGSSVKDYKDPSSEMQDVVGEFIGEYMPRSFTLLHTFLCMKNQSGVKKMIRNLMKIFSLLQGELLFCIHHGGDDDEYDDVDVI